jgi:hypothetical protein
MGMRSIMGSNNNDAPMHTCQKACYKSRELNCPLRTLLLVQNNPTSAIQSRRLLISKKVTFNHIVPQGSSIIPNGKWEPLKTCHLRVSIKLGKKQLSLSTKTVPSQILFQSNNPPCNIPSIGDREVYNKEAETLQSGCIPVSKLQWKRTASAPLTSGSFTKFSRTIFNQKKEFTYRM